MLRRWLPARPFPSPTAAGLFISVPPFNSVHFLCFLFVLALFSVNAQSYESSELRMMEERGGKRMFYQPWSYMKRTPSMEPILRFESAEEDRLLRTLRPLLIADQFAKRSNVVPLIRFGRRPAERAAPLIRFGKRAQIRTDAAPLIRFGRNSEENK